MFLMRWKNIIHTNNFHQIRLYSIHRDYDIPERYRNAFFLANAAFFDDVSWYLHKAYEVCFGTLVDKLIDEDASLSEKEARLKVENVIKIYDQSNYFIDVRFPVKRENGNYELIRGFRAHHGLFSGYYPCLGGLRIVDNVTRDQIKALAAQSTYKHACMGICLSGAHGGIKISPSEYSEQEKQNIIEQYATQLYKKGFCGGQNDIFQPDINTTALEMSWIVSAYLKNIGQNKSSVSTAAAGKPHAIGGLTNYDKAASQAAYFALDRFLNEREITNKLKMTPGIRNKCFIIQGLGKVGSLLAQYLENTGAMCVGVKEHDGYIVDLNGISVKDIIACKEKHGSITYFRMVKPETRMDVYPDDCDILIFAAHQKSLMCYAANEIKAKVILEAADGPLPPLSHKILLDQNKLVIPDVYACSGGAVASYIEYLLNMRQLGIETLRYSKEVYENLLTIMETSQTRAVVSQDTNLKLQDSLMESDMLTYALEVVMMDTANEILNVAKEYNLGLDLRTACYIMAIQNIFKSIYDLKKY